MANQFANDVNCKGVWTCDEDAALDGWVEGHDALGSGMSGLVGNGQLNQVIQHEGDGCGYYANWTDWGYINDVNLVAGFPFKGNDANKQMSLVFWFQLTVAPDIGTLSYIYVKGKTGGFDRFRTWQVHIKNDGGSLYVGFRIGHTDGGDGNTEEVFHDTAIQLNIWYHLGVTFDDATGAYRIRIWDHDANAILGVDKTGNFTNHAFLSATFVLSCVIMSSLIGGDYSGYLDETAFFKDILTATEIDYIRKGIFGLDWKANFYGASSMTADMRVISFAPLVGQWTFPVSEHLKFNTEILQSHDRTEQRIAKHSGIARQSCRTKVFVRGDDACADFEAVLHTWLKKSWPVPQWGQAEPHAGALALGAGSITVATAYADFRADSYALIWQSDDAYEVVNVSTVAANSLTLEAPTVNAYAGDKWIIPCRLGWCVNAGRIERYEGGALCELTWETDVSDLAAVAGYAAPMTYDTYTVLTSPSYWPGGRGETGHDPDVAVLDATTGPFAIISNSDFNETGQNHVWHPQTKQACWELRQFLYAVKGCQTAFLVPTFRKDITLSRAAGAADTTLYVWNRSFAKMGFNSLRTYLAFRPAGAAIIPRKVTGIAAVSAAEESITINTAAGAAFASGSNLCWVDRCRLGSDDIALEWSKWNQLSCNVKLVRVTL